MHNTNSNEIIQTQDHLYILIKNIFNKIHAYIYHYHKGLRYYNMKDISFYVYSLTPGYLGMIAPVLYFIVM